LFTTTHDAILLIIAALYVLIGLARTKNTPDRYRAAGYRPPGPGWYSVPYLVAAALAIVAVLW
jgi:hypothetical protein